MNTKKWMQKTLSMSLVFALCATYSMVVLAASEKAVGELSIVGKSANIMVNGTSAQSEQTIFTSSTIITPEDTSAIISIAKVGRIKLDPNTTLSVSFDEKSISGNLVEGRVTVLNASNAANFNLPDGKTVKLTTGESVATGNAQDDDDDDKTFGLSQTALAVLVVAIGGTIAAIYIATKSDDPKSITITNVSPVR